MSARQFYRFNPGIAILADQPRTISLMGLRFDRLQFIGKSSEELCSFVNRSQLRSLSRSGALLLHLAESGGFREAAAKHPPNRVGIYLACYDGAYPYVLVEQFVEDATADPIELIKGNFPPKAILQLQSGLVSAQLGIHLGIRGPLHVFNHPVWGGYHAMTRAEEDLRKGVVELAIVGAALALDDPFNELDVSEQATERHEGAVLVGFGPEAVVENPSKLVRGFSVSNPRYGIAESLIRFHQGKPGGGAQE